MYTYIDENDLSLIEIEAGLLHWWNEE